MEKKPYWVLMSFLVPTFEPRAGYVCVEAESPEEAEKIVRDNIGADVKDLLIESVSEELPDEVKAQMEPTNGPITVN